MALAASSGPGAAPPAATAGETKVIYHLDEEETPYLVKIPVPADRITLGHVKAALARPGAKYFFKSMDQDFGYGAAAWPAHPPACEESKAWVPPPGGGTPGVRGRSSAAQGAREAALHSSLLLHRTCLRSILRERIATGGVRIT